MKYQRHYKALGYSVLFVLSVVVGFFAGTIPVVGPWALAWITADFRISMKPDGVGLTIACVVGALACAALSARLVYTSWIASIIQTAIFFIALAIVTWRGRKTSKQLVAL